MLRINFLSQSLSKIDGFNLATRMLTVVRQRVHCADLLGSDRMGPVWITVNWQSMHAHVVYNYDLENVSGHFDKNYISFCF